MDNVVLILLVGFISFITLIRSLRSPQESGWTKISLVILIGLGIAASVVPDLAGWVGLGLWSTFILTPAYLVRVLSRHIVRQEYTKARRLCDALRRFLPGRHWRLQSAFVRTLELSQQGNLAGSLQLLDNVRKSDPSADLVVTLQTLRLQGDWEKIVELVPDEERGEPAVESQGAAGTAALLRAFGETGRIDQLVQFYGRYRPVLDSLRVPAEVQAICRLSVFAFCGERSYVENLFAEQLRQYPDLVKKFWLATADLASGDETARQRLSAIASESDPYNLPMVEKRLTQRLPSVESLSLSSRKILSQLKIRVAEEERYGLTSPKVRRLAYATKTLIGLNCIYFLVEFYAGGSTNRETLEKLGALSGNVINSGEWWRVVAASFMHAGVTHLLLNMLGLLILGPYLEFRLGIRRFVPFFLFTSIGAMGYCAAEMYFTNSERMLVGASGFVMAIVGAIGAYMYYGWKFERSALARKNFTLIVILVVLQLTVDASIPEISIQAHASGLVLGVVGIILLQLGTLFALRGRDAPTTTSRDAT